MDYTGSPNVGPTFGSDPESLPRGSKYATCNDPGPKYKFQLWLLGPETSNTGYLNSLGLRFGP